MIHLCRRIELRANARFEIRNAHSAIRNLSWEISVARWLVAVPGIEPGFPD